MIERLYIMPTHQCNCRCVYCYLPEEERRKSGNDKIIIENTKKFISLRKEQKSNNSIPQIRFIGGEPYLKDKLIRDVCELFLPACKKGLVVINTNGTLISDEIIDLYKEEFIKKITHIISLDGIQSIHDKRRVFLNGEGSFTKVIRGIKNLQKKNMPVYINMVLDQFSFEYIEDFLLYITQELKIHELSVSLLYDAAVNDLGPKDKFNLLKDVYYLATKYNVTISGHHRLLLGKKIPELKCKAGEKSILLTCDGNITGCQRFVGRTNESYTFDKVLRNKDNSIKNMVEEYCYSEEALELGNMIYEFYQREYPYYLKINNLDKIVFGVI